MTDKSRFSAKLSSKLPWFWGFVTPETDFCRSRQLYTTIRNLDRVLLIAQTSNALAFTFCAGRMIYGHTLIVFPFNQFSAFAVLQSRLHQLWAASFAATMKDDLRYIPTDCFETFPFPSNFESSPELEATGKAHYEFRADLMARTNEGLTKTHNRFHDPNEASADIIKLRELHAAMDRAVLDAYGDDLAKLAVPPCEFLLDYEDEEDEDEPATGGRQRKKPWRYRWPDVFRDEVLALLLDLNKKQAEEEKLTALPPAKPKKATRKKAAPPSGTPDLF